MPALINTSNSTVQCTTSTVVPLISTDDVLQYTVSKLESFRLDGILIGIDLTLVEIEQESRSRVEQVSFQNACPG
jgi:hypothetical protein